MSTLFFWYGGWGYVIPRLMLAILFLVHGISKMKDLKATAKDFDRVGFKPGAVLGPIAAFVETFGGIGIFLGIWVPYICLVLIGQFGTIILWKIFLKKPFMYDWDLDMTVFALVLTFFTLYGGFYLI